ncbi:MAG: hypothetical protein P8130_10920 [Deltaproteobacteria bacterium]
MQKIKVILLTAALVLGLSSVSFAGYVGGFKVVGVTESQVTIQKGQEKPVQVKVDHKRYRVGEKVKYDAEKGKLRKEPRKLEGC